MTPKNCYDQGMEFYYGTEIDTDYEISLYYLREAIKHYHVPSQTQVALMYLEGNGVEKNYDSAMVLVEKSMDKMELKLDLDECY
jgi:TPR repeat protein